MSCFSIFSDGLSKHEAVFCELLNETEKPPSFGPPLRTLMKLPLDRIKCYAYLLKKLTEYYPQVGTDIKISRGQNDPFEKLILG